MLYEENRNKQGCYILTHDLGRHIERFRVLGLKTPNHDDPFFTAFKKGLEERISPFYPKAELKSLFLHDLVQKIWAEVIQRQSLVPSAVIVSTFQDFHNKGRGFTLEINRLYDLQGQKIGFGSRPGNLSLSEQFKNLSAVVKKNHVILVEDGAGSGKTIVNILEQLKSRGLSVSVVVLGFASEEGTKAIKEVFDGEIVTIENVPNVIDWMPDHDFFPFTPNCGRVIGMKFGSEFHPLYVHGSFPLAIPYIFPFGNPEDWASIPTGPANLFSLYCLRSALELFTRIEKMNGDKFVTLADLMGTNPAVRIPVSINGGNLISSSTRVTEYLSELLQNYVIVSREFE